MNSFIVALLVRYLISLGVERINRDLHLKEGAIEWVRDHTGPMWLEEVTVQSIDFVWDIVLGSVLKYLTERSLGSIDFSEGGEEVWLHVATVTDEISSKNFV